MAKLVIEKGAAKGRTVNVPTEGEIVAGRDENADICLRDTMCSRSHFKIVISGETFKISDMGSMNGTLVNGEPVEGEQELHYGDLIKAGETLLSFMTDEDAKEPLIGTRMGGYRIIERIGRGGMGTVYRAEQIDLQREVALKVISEENTQDRNFIELFVHEARAAGKLNHTNIVQVYDVKRYDKLYYFSMEYVPGGSVQELLNKVRKIPFDRALAMVLDAARGLEYAHKKDLIHRDVKPDNLMLGEEGTVKIADLGLARSPKENVGPDEENTVIGTPHYIAPEQVLGHPADFRSDIYGLGGTFYRMVTGITPFQAPTIRDLVNKKVREDPRPANEVNPEVSQRGAEIIAKMMVRDPAMRYQSMGEVITDIEVYLRERSGKGVEQPTSVDKLTSNRKFLIGAAVGAAVLLGVAVVGIAAMLGGPEEIEPPTPVDNGKSEEVAQMAFINAEQFEVSRMDAKDPASIEEAIKRYDGVRKDHSDSRYALESDKRIEALTSKLNGIRAAREMDTLERLDIEGWQKAYQLFQQGTLDLSAIDKTILRYQDFAADKDYEKSDSAERARLIVAHIKRWKEAVLREEKEYRGVLDEVDKLVAQEKFRDAWNKVDDYQQRVRALEMKESPVGDRYAILFFNESAAQKARDIGTLAQADFIKRRNEARRLAARNEYQEAISNLRPVTENSLDAQKREALSEIYNLEQKHVDFVRLEKEKADAERDRKLNADKALFDREALKIYEDYVRKFQFATAAERVRSLRFESEQYALRQDQRVSELQTAEQFKARFVGVINDAVKRSRDEVVDLKFNLSRSGKGGLKGKIAKADDQSLDIQLEGTIGRYQHYYYQWSPDEFHDWLSKAWRLKTQYVTERSGLAVLCMELGLYDKAQVLLLEIRGNPVYKSDKQVREFCEKYLAMIKNQSYTDSDEVEALKRFLRLKWFDSQKMVPEAARELDALDSLYMNTSTYRQNESRINEIRKVVEDKGGSEIKIKRTQSRMDRIKDAVESERTAVRKNRDGVRDRLSRVVSPISRAYNLGDYYSAHGERYKSSEKYAEALTAAERLLGKPGAPDFGRSMMTVASCYLGLYRNQILAKNKPAAQKIRNDASRRFFDPDSQREYRWWRESMDAMTYWGEEVFGKLDIRAARSALEDDPENPEAVWKLALSLDLSFGSDELVEARALYRHLIRHHPDFREVRSGNATFRLAELLFLFREIPEAVELYEEMREKHREHERVEDRETLFGIPMRIQECYGLLVRMGYVEGKQDERLHRR